VRSARTGIVCFSAEKEGSTKGLGGQITVPIYQATAFGYEKPIDESQIELARQILIEVIPVRSRKEIWQTAKTQFVSGVGDTSRPINDITLWDLSSSVASFYKAAVARLVLDNTRHDHFKQWRELQLNTTDGESLTWRVSTVMGDGSTLDNWYPYVYVVHDKDCNPVTGRTQFVHPQHSDQHWVYVKDVWEGDIIRFAPGHFSWIFLDTSARRFDVGKRTAQPLEELERITNLWRKLKELARSTTSRLSDSTLHAVVTLLKTKGELWGRASKQFEDLVRAVLVNEGLGSLSLEDVTSGRLQATFELYCQILKQKLKEN
jgi:hypothetical protein